MTKAYFFKLKLSKNQSGFSLIEVVVSFAILAGLSVVMIQSQLSTVRFLNNTKQIDFVGNLLKLELQKYEINPLNEDFTELSGEFNDDFELDEASWKLVQVDDSILSVPMKRITYTISWFENGVAKSTSDFIIIEPPLTSIDDFLQSN